MMAWRSVVAGLFLFLGFTAAHGQSKPAVLAAKAACGPADARFQVTFAPESGQSAVPQGVATVYVIETPVSPTLRIGLNGAWVGAEKAASYISFPVPPGMNHLCVQWQSKFNGIASTVALNSVDAQPDHVYYFIVSLLHPIGLNRLRLEALNEGEGKELVAKSRHAVAALVPPNSQ